MKFKNTIFISVMAFCSCNQSNIIEKSKFKEILTKIHQCEAYNELKFKNTNAPFLNQCKANVLTEYKIDLAQYEKTMSHYRNDSKAFEEIYDSILKYNIQNTN
jgi:Domain of unknown function (DUF4296)